MKDECAGKHIIEIVGLRAQMYSIIVKKYNEKLTAKGIKRSYVDHHLCHESFLQTLAKKTATQAEFYTIRFHLHSLHAVRINKEGLSPYDDKRYILADGVHTLAYGHYRIP
jgi:hypothetical protein